MPAGCGACVSIRVGRTGGVFDLKRFNHVVSQIEALGWVVDLHLDPDFLEPHAELMRRLQLPLVIDHFANVHSQHGKDEKEYKLLFDPLGERHTGSRSAAPTGCSRAVRATKMSPMAQALIARAPDRIIWGTDWPH